jgi:hypothetical protein
MENLDIIILSSIVSTLFLVFMGTVIKEFIKMNKNPEIGPDNSPRTNMIKYIGKLFDTPVKNDDEANMRINQYSALQNLIADMESNGVYFPEDVKKELQKKREDLTCEYSGLPSPTAYDESLNRL